MSLAHSRADVPQGKIAATHSPGAIASVEVLNDFAAARVAWEAIVARGAVASPYQSYAFAKDWSQTIGAATGVSPMIAIAREENGEIAALLPLGRFRRGPLVVASFLGGRMANYHMGLFARDRDGAEVAALLLEAAAQSRPRVDVFAFVNQPPSWCGAVNPLAALSQQPSPSFAYASELSESFEVWRDAHFSKSAQKKLRKKAKRLETLGPLGLRRAASDHEARRLLDAFFAQKRARAAERAHGAEFDDGATHDFLHRLVAFSETGAPALELYGLFAGERIVAVFGGFAGEGRLSGAFLSHDRDPDIAPSSPGELLILEIARNAIERGLGVIDFGVGEARYKSEICETTEPLFDSAFAISAAGRLGAAAFLLARRLKRQVKADPRLYAFARSARGWFA